MCAQDATLKYKSFKPTSSMAVLLPLSPRAALSVTVLKVRSFPLMGMVPHRARPGYVSEAFTPGEEFMATKKLNSQAR